MNKMLLVNDVEVIVVSDDPCEITHYPELHISKEACPPAEKYGVTEQVHGQEFIDPRTGERALIGFTRMAENKLRLPLGAFRGMSKHITELLRENNKLTSQVMALNTKLQRGHEEFEAIAGMGFLKRLLFLFKGKRMYNPNGGN